MMLWHEEKKAYDSYKLKCKAQRGRVKRAGKQRKISLFFNMFDAVIVGVTPWYDTIKLQNIERHFAWCIRWIALYNFRNFKKQWMSPFESASNICKMKRWKYQFSPNSGMAIYNFVHMISNEVDLYKKIVTLDVIYDYVVLKFLI